MVWYNEDFKDYNCKPTLPFSFPLIYKNILQGISLSFSLCPYISLLKARFISPIVQVGRLIGFLYYGELSVDWASDSEPTNGEVHKDWTAERAPGLWVHMQWGEMDAGWDKDMLLQREEKQERGRVKSNKSYYMTSMFVFFTWREKVESFCWRWSSLLISKHLKLWQHNHTSLFSHQISRTLAQVEKSPNLDGKICN